MLSYDVVVVGGGPAGIMTAVFASKNLKVCLLEKNTIVGRKLLATGNGRCNITNKIISSDRYYGSLTSIFDSIYSRFNQQETEKFFTEHGVALKEEDRGRVFPITNQAETVRDVLEQAMVRVDVRTSAGVKGINFEGPNSWKVTLENGEQVSASSVVVATGGKAAFQFGSSGDGLFWAKKLGIEQANVYAALVPLITEPEIVSGLMGVKQAVKVGAFVDGHKVAEKLGEVMFTHYGVSGPAAMGVSGELAKATGLKKLVIDLLPDISYDDLEKFYITQNQNHPKRSVETITAGILPKALAKKVVSLTGGLDIVNVSELSKKKRQELIETIKALEVQVSGVRPLKEAQVSGGGIAASAVTNDLESVKYPGLYFVGEALDIYGDSGGFNLQWAWSSGAMVGNKLSGTNS